MPDEVGSVIWICLGMVLLGGFGLFISWYLRRRLMNPADDGPAGGFSLEGLRKLHREGKMSDAEFETTKALIAKLQSKQLNEPKPEKPAGSTKTGR
jgi:hypothetical protein